MSSPAPSQRRKYTGASHSWLVLGPPAVGLIASAVLVFTGPLSWWLNYLVIGAVWGLSLPVRQVARVAFKHVTYEFRGPTVNWSFCVRDEIAEQRATWREEAGKMAGAYVGIALLEILGWPLLIPLGAMLNEQLDHG